MDISIELISNSFIYCCREGNTAVHRTLHILDLNSQVFNIRNIQETNSLKLEKVWMNFGSFYLGLSIVCASLKN